MNTLRLIREVRNQTGLGLKESKDIVDGWANGTTEGKGLKELVEQAVKDRGPRSEEARQAIRNKIKRLQSLIDNLDDTCEDDFGSEELTGIRDALGQIAEEALTIKERTTYLLEECIDNES